MLLNPYRFASAGGGSGHRYWRWIDITLKAGVNYLAIQELRLVGTSGSDLAATMTASGGLTWGDAQKLADDVLNDDSPNFSAATVTGGGFWIEADLGSDQEVVGTRFSGAQSSTESPTGMTLQWSDDGSSWTTARSWSGIAHPGASTMSQTYLLTDPASGHRYWRWSGISLTGSYLEISELRVVDAAGTRYGATMTSSAAPSYASAQDLADGSTSTRTYWDAATATAGGFWIQADLGLPYVVAGMQMASYNTSDHYPSDVTLQWSDDGSSWTTFGTWSGLTYPGNNTAGPVLTP